MVLEGESFIQTFHSESSANNRPREKAKKIGKKSFIL